MGADRVDQLCTRVVAIGTIQVPVSETVQNREAAQQQKVTM